MSRQIKDRIDRALQPAFLIALTVLLIPLAHDGGCARWHVAKILLLKEELEKGGCGSDARLSSLLSAVKGYAQSVDSRFLPLASLLVASLLAYVVFARERLRIRLSVVATASLITLASTFLFGSIC